LPRPPLAPREVIAPPPRRTPRWRLVVFAGVVLALLVPVTAVARTHTRPPRAQAASPGPAPPPPSPPQLPATAVCHRLRTALGPQAKGLLAGDRAGYLAPVEAADTTLREAFTRRFGSLRAMQVSVWDQRFGAMAQGVDNTWAMQVTVRYCFVAPDC